MNDLSPVALIFFIIEAIWTSEEFVIAAALMGCSVWSASAASAVSTAAS